MQAKVSKLRQRTQECNKALTVIEVASHQLAGIKHAQTALLDCWRSCALIAVPLPGKTEKDTAGA
jgi:hypothetical protein